MLKDQTLSHSLINSWQKYKKQVHLSRDKISNRHIHDLRISTRKLEAILNLVNALHPTKRSRYLISLIKKVRKDLGPLRDIQVEAEMLKKHNNETPNLKNDSAFIRFIAKQKRRKKKEANRHLKDISLKSEKLSVDKVVKKIEQIELQKGQKKIQSLLVQEIKSSMLKFNQVLTKMSAGSANEVHQVRIIAKKLRYRSYFLNATNGLGHFDLVGLKGIQNIAGQIQNDSILLNSLDQFLAEKSPDKHPNILKLRKRVVLHQTKLINKSFKEFRTLKWQN